MANRSLAARKAWVTRRRVSAFTKARASEAASKEALRAYCQTHGWRLAFFEGPTGSPRTGIIDAVMFRLDRQDADSLDIRLVQLKGGRAGHQWPGDCASQAGGCPCSRGLGWIVAAFDGDALHVVPPLTERGPIT